MKAWKGIGLALVASVALVASGTALAQEKLVVWWVKGFYKSEDDALYEAIKKYEAKSGIKVELSQYAVQDGIPKTVAALDAGTPPDVAYIDVFDFQVTGKWAFEGKLEDISDVMTPIKDKFLPNTLETTYLYNSKSNKYAYYAFPLKQQTMHIQYWKDMLKEGGLSEADIPATWKEYWNFWCDKAQPAYRKASGKRAFGIGQPMGVDSSDSYFSFLTFMDGYNVKLVDDKGKVLVDDPKVRAGLVNAVRDYAAPYGKGCVPPSATSWKDPDNNVAFHNKTILMTHNATISIAAKWFDDMNNASLSQAERDQAKKNYFENIATAGFPKKPDGSTFTYRAAVKTGVVFSEAKNKKRAREFVAFMMEDENLTPYVEGSLGRWYPVTKSGAARLSFWLADPHRASVQRQFAAGTVPFEFTKNWKFTILNNENVWAKAVNRVASEKWTPEKAADEMIARIKEVTK